MSGIEHEGSERLENSAGINEADESHATEALRNAIEAGYMTEDDVRDYLGDDVQDILIGVASYIEMAGHDAETILREWGVVSDEI